MRYLLDTNVCVDYLTGRYPSVAARLLALAPSDVCLSSVVVAELRYGADRSAHPRRNHRMLDILTGRSPAGRSTAPRPGPTARCARTSNAAAGRSAPTTC